MFALNRFASVFLTFSALGLAAGCASFSKKDSGVRQVDDLVGRVGRVHLEAEVSRERVRDALADLQAIVAGDIQGDPIAAFDAFVEAVERSEEQAEALRRTDAPMRKAASAVFDRWEADLLTYSTPELRNKSRNRLEATRKRFEQVVIALDRADSAYETYNLGLRDHATFLSNDFNPASVRGIRKQVRALSAWGQEVDQRLEAVLAACESYVGEAAPPGTPEEAQEQQVAAAEER